MKIMKGAKIFLGFLLLASACQKREENMVDLDQMALAEEEIDSSHLEGCPLETPQEVLINTDSQNQ